MTTSIVVRPHYGNLGLYLRTRDPASGSEYELITVLPNEAVAYGIIGPINDICAGWDKSSLPTNFMRLKIVPSEEQKFTTFTWSLVAVDTRTDQEHTINGELSNRRISAISDHSMLVYPSDRHRLEEKIYNASREVSQTQRKLTELQTKHALLEEQLRNLNEE